MATSLRMSAGSLSGAAAQQAAPRRAASAMVPSVRPFGSRLTAATRSSPAVNARMTVAAAAVETAPPSVAQSTTNKYAIVEIGGTQMLVEEGRWYECNRLEAEPGSKIQLGRVIAHNVDGNFTVGQPYLENVTVEAEVLEELKGPKILVYKMKPKKHYRRMKGHRQHLSKFKITKISA